MEYMASYSFSEIKRESFASESILLNESLK